MRFHRLLTGGFESSPSLQGERGFTLVEVMAATVISVMVIGAGFTAVISSERSLRVNDQVAQTQQNSRIAMELIARDVKMAGFGMTGPVGACTIGGNAAPIVPADNNVGGVDVGPDSVSLVVPLTNSNPTVGTVWTLRTPAVGPFTQVSLQGTSAVDGAVPDMVTAGLVAGSTVSIGGAVSSPVAVGGVDLANNRLTLTNQIGAPREFPIGTQVFLLNCITYQVIAPGDAQQALCGASAPCLVRGVADTTVPPNNLNCNTLPNTCVAVVEAIEDLQLAYACDGCNVAVNGGIPDGIPDDQNASSTFDTADFLTNNAWATPPLTPDKIRLVQATIVARQELAELGTGEGTTAAMNTAGPVIAGDHDPSDGVFAAGDYDATTYTRQRRRLLTRTIQTRNMGI